MSDGSQPDEIAYGVNEYVWACEWMADGQVWAVIGRGERRMPYVMRVGPFDHDKATAESIAAVLSGARSLRLITELPPSEPSAVPVAIPIETAREYADMTFSIDAHVVMRDLCRAALGEADDHEPGPSCEWGPSPHDRIESTLGAGWSALVPHLRGSQRGPALLPDDHLADDVAALDRLRAENESLRAVLAALLLDHGTDGRLVVSDRAMLHVIRSQAQADVVVWEHPKRWTVEERP